MRNGKSIPHPYRSLLLYEWPDSDRRAWEETCRPGLRLRAGGAASRKSSLEIELPNGIH
jgi:hypothetical protein